MEESSSDKETLLARIQQLEHERDELHKDIEQLCMQQAGPGYLFVATKMHFQRTAGLEQEIENLKKKLTACTRENLNLQEELSEAYQIKTQLADLHGAEVTKNEEAEKQLKFFQGCVAAAFAERDHSIMEAEKAKEKEELMSQKLNENQTRLEELTQDCLELKKKNDSLLINIAKEEERNEIFKTIIDKFYEIRQQSPEGPEDLRWDDKCACLLDDPAESWTYNDPSTSKYINALEEEVDTLRNSMENLRNKFQMGLEIEKHLKKRVRELEKKIIRSDKRIKIELAELQQCHSLHRENIRKLLDEEKSRMKSIIDAVEENIKQFVSDRGRNSEASRADVNLNENECIHVSADLDANFVAERNAPVSPDVVEDGNLRATEALTQALQDKVQTLLLLSQQEERHLLERNVNAALQKKVEELQRNLQQVTNEKVKALMDFAQLKQEYQLLREKTGPEMRQRNVSPDNGERRVVAHERDGRLRNLIKKSYLKRWVGTMDFRGGESESNLNSEGNVSGGKSNSTMDFARMRVENATLKESLESIEHLTSSVHRLRLSLLKAKELLASEETEASAHDTLDSIIKEAKIIKTALGSSLPVSWSAEADLASLGESACNETSDDISGDSRSEKMESVSAAGFEMVELLILASEVLKHDTIGPASEGRS